MSYTVKITRYVTETVEISREEAAKYIIEAKINVPGELDLYVAMRNNGYMRRIATIPAPKHLDRTDHDILLAYAREHLPESLDIRD